MTTEAPRQKVGTGFWHQRCAPRRFKRIVAAILAAALPLTSLHADVGSSMDSFLSDVGGAANVNGPTAFQGQSAGYYSLGNVWTRFPQKTTNIANLQLPRARAGCGGIDIFAGSFSFINASEIVAMLKAVANNAVGFAFSLAIDTVCPECSKIMQEFAQKGFISFFPVQGQFFINNPELVFKDQHIAFTRAFRDITARDILEFPFYFQDRQFTFKTVDYRLHPHPPYGRQRLQGLKPWATASLRLLK